MITLNCKHCGIERTVTKKYSDYCRSCSVIVKNHRKVNGMYPHKCKDCHKEWSTITDTQAIRCKSCSTKYKIGISHPAAKLDKDKVKYSYTCTECEETFATKYNPKRKKTTLCGECSRRATGLSNSHCKTDAHIPSDKGKYFRICERCNDKLQVNSPRAALSTMCASCRFETRSERKKTNTKKKKKTKGVPRGHVTVDGRQKVRVKFQTVDLDTLQNSEHIKPSKKYKLHTDEECENMVDKWLKDNKPSINIKHGLPLPHIGSTMYIEGE